MLKAVQQNAVRPSVSTPHRRLSAVGRSQRQWGGARGLFGRRRSDQRAPELFCSPVKVMSRVTYLVREPFS